MLNFCVRKGYQQQLAHCSSIKVKIIVIAIAQQIEPTANVSQMLFTLAVKNMLLYGRAKLCEYWAMSIPRMLPKVHGDGHVVGSLNMAF